ERNAKSKWPCEFVEYRCAESQAEVCRWRSSELAPKQAACEPVFHTSRGRCLTPNTG
ncbi:hypothetical protein J6590_100433, partial [Homalodisca vitripennis]